MVSRMHVKSGFYPKALGVALDTPMEDWRMKLKPSDVSQSYAQPLRM